MCAAEIKKVNRFLCYSLALIGILSALPGCGPGGLITTQSAPCLVEFNAQGAYTPYYATGEMNQPRYLHQAILLDNNMVFVASGSDETGFSSLDSAELYDQGNLKKDEKAPESLKGTWFDTDFEGNPMLLKFGRLYHTLTELRPSNKILIVGGVPNLSRAFPVAKAEIFDPLTRTFEQVDADMDEPRFRHTASVLPGGSSILIAGGQIHSTFQEQLEIITIGGTQSGSTSQIQIPTDIFPSTKKCEVFSTIDSTFTALTIKDSTLPALLTSPRGRADHAVERFAGPDNQLNTGDDLLLLAGGFQTFSGENAPQTKFPGEIRKNALVEIEFFDPTFSVFNKVPVLRLIGPRVNGGQVTNLGTHNEITIDGVRGMGNALLINCGDDDDPFGVRDTTIPDEVLIATFTGFGPARGLQLFRQEGAQGEHIQGIEYIFNTGASEVAPFPPPGRSTANVVSMPRSITNLAGSQVTTSWIFAGAGVHLFTTPGGQGIWFDGTIASGCIFDPFYSLTAILDFQANARDLRPRRTNRNPVGIVGTWLACDGLIPTGDLVGFGDIPPGSWSHNKANRVWCRLVAIPGVNGLAGDTDDRVLFIGGGRDVGFIGGEPSFPSTELFLIPGTGCK